MKKMLKTAWLEADRTKIFIFVQKQPRETLNFVKKQRALRLTECAFFVPGRLQASAQLDRIKKIIYKYKQLIFNAVAGEGWSREG